MAGSGVVSSELIVSRRLAHGEQEDYCKSEFSQQQRKHQSAEDVFELKHVCLKDEQIDDANDHGNC